MTEADIQDFGYFYGASNDEETADYFAEITGLHVILDQKLYKTEIRDDADGVIGPTEFDEETPVNLEVAVEGDTITLTPDTPESSSADIVKADIEASNGIAHIIDVVMWPPLPD